MPLEAATVYIPRFRSATTLTSVKADSPSDSSSLRISNAISFRRLSSFARVVTIRAPVAENGMIEPAQGDLEELQKLMAIQGGLGPTLRRRIHRLPIRLTCRSQPVEYGSSHPVVEGLAQMVFVLLEHLGQ